MKKMIIFAICCLFYKHIDAKEKWISPKISCYVDFVESCNTSPVDYIMGLFDIYDVVILGERDHRDITQYKLIEQIISDQRFIDKVGNVMTEVGVYNMSDKLNQLLKSNFDCDDDFNKALWELYKEIDYTPLWEKTNFYYYLNSIYNINKTLPNDSKINVSLLDIPFSWNQTHNMTNKQFQSFYRIWDSKDIIMGNNAITELYKIFNGVSSRKKALIIMNTPHSLSLRGSELEKDKMPNKFNYYAGQIIMDRFPGKVSNVMINSIYNDDKKTYKLVHNGRWDAAFAVVDNKSIGFDFISSPFGDDMFDLGGRLINGKRKYKELYTGFIFYKPPHEWILEIGVPIFKDSTYSVELLRRENIWDGSTPQNDDSLDEIFEYYSTLRFITPFDSVNIYNRISKYYRPGF